MSKAKRGGKNGRRTELAVMYKGETEEHLRREERTVSN